MDDVSIHKTRMRLGETLGEKIRRLRPDLDIDVIIPIPDTRAMPRNPWPTS